MRPTTGKRRRVRFTDGGHRSCQRCNASKPESSRIRFSPVESKKAPVARWRFRRVHRHRSATFATAFSLRLETRTPRSRRWCRLGRGVRSERHHDLPDAGGPGSGSTRHAPICAARYRCRRLGGFRVVGGAEAVGTMRNGHLNPCQHELEGLRSRRVRAVDCRSGSSRLSSPAST